MKKVININSKSDYWDYDSLNDSFFAFSKGVQYKSSIEIDGVLLDVGMDNSIVGIEILDAAKRFGISKYDMKNLKQIRADIKVSEESINIKLLLEVSKRNRELPLKLSITGANEMKLPSTSSGTMAVAA
ncbi:DUF2283 domain-containing protein [Methanohalophilus sp. RSK]|uniref:DUF2283 domain-containing protein n=1 Tax=Methanohalophilus sp. RSK TaxID=2485783 RepID=UPI000F43B80C|nr:DUF2283 domain-containing protein [Methanohalophilus sp. RSK]RNI15792.1 DUF2283 domain-containing protein [Methanohalophilus sp. RSK]